jgi:ABC-type transport system involved in cytochrome c biogenesis permease component
VPRIWQVRPPSKLRRRWQEWYRGFSHGEQHERPRLRQKAFQVNPVTWLDSRDYTQTALLQIVVAAYFILCGFFDCGKFRSVISAEMIAAASVAVYYGICLWIAFRAGDRFIQDRQSGALELLLTTPLSTGEIVKGRMRGIHRQFSWAVAILGILAWFLVDADRIFSQDSWICKAVVLLFPLQTYTLARVGLCQGLKQKGLLQAVLASSLQVLLLPWLGFVAVVVCDDRLWRGNIGRLGIFYAIVWFVCHVVVCLGCLARANWKLKNHFRQLASEPISQWWRW